MRDEKQAQGNKSYNCCGVDYYGPLCPPNVSFMMIPCQQQLVRATLQSARVDGAAATATTMAQSHRLVQPIASALVLSSMRGYAQGPGINPPGGSKTEFGGIRRWPPKIWQFNLAIASIFIGTVAALSKLSVKNSSKDQ